MPVVKYLLLRQPQCVLRKAQTVQLCDKLKIVLGLRIDCKGCITTVCAHSTNSSKVCINCKLLRGKRQCVPKTVVLNK